MSKDAVYEFVARVDSDPEIGGALRGAAGVDAVVRVAAERGLQFTAGELAPVLDLLRFLDSARRDAWLRGELASAPDHAAVVALGRRRGYAFSSDELAHLNVAPAAAQLDDRDLDRVVGGTAVSGLQNTGLKLSLGLSVQRQAPNTSFGSIVASGVVGGIVPGGAIISAAVSSVSNLAGSSSSSAASSQYAATSTDDPD